MVPFGLAVGTDGALRRPLEFGHLLKMPADHIGGPPGSGRVEPSQSRTGLRPSAQGCRVREATLGEASENCFQPQRGCVTTARHRNPVGVEVDLADLPRVARSSQPWADRRSPFGAETASVHSEPGHLILGTHA